MLDSYKMMVIYSSESIFWSALSNALILSVLYFLPYQQETWGKSMFGGLGSRAR